MAHLILPHEEPSIKGGEVIWMERRDTGGICPLVKWIGTYGNYFEYLVPEEIAVAANYGDNFRCWRECPTDEERAAEPWRNLSEEDE